MANFAFLFNPSGGGDAADIEAARPAEIEAVLKQWRREGLAVELPKEAAATLRRREEKFGDLMSEFPVAAVTTEGVYHCQKCIRTVTLKALAPKICPECGGPLVEQRASEIYNIGDTIGASFVSRKMPDFHLSVDTLIRTLDLPRWFLHLGPHMKQMRMIPVNFANLFIMSLLVFTVPFAVIALILGFLQKDPSAGLLWKGYATAGVLVSAGLLAVRPLLQTYVRIGRDRIMLMAFGARRVLHFHRVDEIRNDRRLNGWGYAAYLGEMYSPLLKWPYALLFQWIDPRNWFSLYPDRCVEQLSPRGGIASSAYFRNRVVIRSEKNLIRLPYNGRLRRDLTQALAIVVFQVRSMSPNAKIELSALQVAQRPRATTEQWQAGIRR